MVTTPPDNEGETAPLNTTGLPSIKKGEETDNEIEEAANVLKLAETCPGDTLSASSKVIMLAEAPSRESGHSPTLHPVSQSPPVVSAI
jgi:hypothetical protein